jgi:hypothetical protein
MELGASRFPFLSSVTKSSGLIGTWPRMTQGTATGSSTSMAVAGCTAPFVKDKGAVELLELLVFHQTHRAVSHGCCRAEDWGRGQGSLPLQLQTAQIPLLMLGTFDLCRWNAFLVESKLSEGQRFSQYMYIMQIIANLFRNIQYKRIQLPGTSGSHL